MAYKLTFKQSCVQLCTYGLAGVGAFSMFLWLGKTVQQWREK